jgi:alpha-beta hydrolase superfamily lysophospholipase
MIKKVLITVAGVYLLLLVGLYFFQEKLIFQSKKLPKNFIFSFDGDFKEINLTTEDNSTINGLHFKVKNSKGIIVYFHGNRGSLERWGSIASTFNAYGYDVFVMDYRGYGKSTGKRTEENLYSDALLCYNHIKKSYSEDNIILYGRSLGATFASYIASKHKPKQLLLEAPFYNLVKTADSHYPFTPTFLLKYKFSSNQYIPKVKCPITIFHGTSDKVISYTDGKKLFNKITTQHKAFVTIENGTHHNLSASSVYKDKIKELLN